MRRTLICGFLLFLLTRLAAAQEVTFANLWADPDRQKVMREGLKRLKAFFKYEADADASRKPRLRARAAAKRDKAMLAFRSWLDDTMQTMAEDLRAHPQVVLRLIDRARVDAIGKLKVKKGKIDYRVVKVQGYSRKDLAFAVLLPEKYDPKNNNLYPLVISLHGRVLGTKHPAMTKNRNERGRKTIWDNWFRSPAADEVVVIAPTWNPDGFKYAKNTYDERHALLLAMGRGLTDYRTDWQRVFVEVHAQALRLLCEQAPLFAGFIVRDREDTRKPFIPEEERFIFDNLNGQPLCYIADEARWKKVGKPMSEALAKAYRKAGKPENLLVLRAKRNANLALDADPERLRDFISKHRRPIARKQLHWRFFNADMVGGAFPVDIHTANYSYDGSPAARLLPLALKAGTLDLACKRATFKDTDGVERPLNRIEISVTEAEDLTVRLYDGLVNLDHPITVVVNGEVIHDKVVVRRDWDFFVKNILPRRYFMMPIVANIRCKFELKRQFEAPKAPVGKEGEKNARAGAKDAADGAVQDASGEAAAKKTAGG